MEKYRKRKRDLHVVFMTLKNPTTKFQGESSGDAWRCTSELYKGNKGHV